MTESNIKNTRIFIYVDVSLLYSIYSQVFEGITDRVVEERINQLLTGETQGTVLKQASAESQALEASRRTESTILHDHMYNRLELRLDGVLQDANQVNSENMTELFVDKPIVKVSGRAEIEDYAKIQMLLEKFNDLAGIIAYAHFSQDPEFQKSRKEIEQKLSEEKIKSERKRLEVQLENMSDLRWMAVKQGLSQDQVLLNNFNTFAKIFNPSGYDVVITPFDVPTIHYRGILNRDWLRSDPQLLSSLYGGQSEAPWTMVGIVTHIPGTFKDLGKNNQIEVKEPTSDPNNPMMLDAFRRIFRQGRFFERMFLESVQETEIVVAPLAIYREFVLPISK